MAESLLLCTTRVSTFQGQQQLTAASGFFFERGPALYLVTSRHVLHEQGTGHLPDRIEFVLHLDAVDLTRTAVVAVHLYQEGRARWRQASDSGGEIDVAVLLVDRACLPAGAVFHAFSPAHLLPSLEQAEIGRRLLVVGFPLGFFDTLHHLPVARHAVIASAFGVRFQGQGYFLTDSRLHRGASGAPVVARDDSLGAVPWRLLGIHSARREMGNRDAAEDERLGLNSAWYADILLTLTDTDRTASPQRGGPGTPRRDPQP